VSVEGVTFGCRLYAYESEVIQGAASGGVGESIGGISGAVTGEAVRQARQSIRRLKRERPAAQIVVTGCAAQTEAATFAAMPEVARVLGNDEKLDPCAWVASDKVAVGDIMASRTLKPHTIDNVRGLPRGFVQVQNGCDHRCTFCIIPYGRGNSRSLSVSDVVTQVRRLVGNGVPEVVLTGVDITSYADGDLRLGGLVKRILGELPELARLRLSSIDSVEADADLIDALATEPRLMPHLHLSLQAGDDLILKRMKRRHLRADAIEFCTMIRRVRPDIAFGADIITGFPTETEERFARSFDLVDECGLTQLHVFPFSPRPGTPASRMPQVARDVVKERARRLREKGEMALRRHLEMQVGGRVQVLSESKSIARTEQFIPVQLSAACAPGEMLNVAIAAHDGRNLIAA
jgi:threonylcarbamoyladenosine tRNA methylthiotransferase MtaB